MGKNVYVLSCVNSVYQLWSWLGYQGGVFVLGKSFWLIFFIGTFFNDVLFVFFIQMRQGRGRLGEEDFDVDIEGYDDEEEDGKFKILVLVSMFIESLWLYYIFM